MGNQTDDLTLLKLVTALLAWQHCTKAVPQIGTSFVVADKLFHITGITFNHPDAIIVFHFSDGKTIYPHLYATQQR